MAKITVLGVGLVGKAIALDLAEQHQVTAVDIDKTALDNLASRNNSIQTINCDLARTETITSNISNADLVVNAVPGFMGYKTLETIIRCGKDVVDIAFCPENTLDLDSLARQHNVTAIVDMGVAPGLSNLLLGYHNAELQVQNFKCMVGGLPKFPKPPFNYKAPFSPVDVIEEYTRPARIVRDGAVLTLPALSEIEQVELPGVSTLEAFNTDGLRTLINSFPDTPNMVEKTLRYPGHAALMQSLIDIGFLNTEPLKLKDVSLRPMDFTSELLKQHWRLKDDEPEFTVMSINISGYSKNDPQKCIEYHYFLYDEFDPVSGIASMARTTGYTCTAAVKLLLDNRIPAKGVIPPETVGQLPECFDEIMKHYQQRNIILEQISGKPVS